MIRKKRNAKSVMKPYKKVNLSEEFGKGKTAYYDFGIFKMSVMHYGKSKNIHINLNRAKKPYKNIDTLTLHSSIAEEDKKYTEVWLDLQLERQGKSVVGMELMWE